MRGTAGVPEYQKIMELPGRVRCRESDAKGRAVVTIRWARE
jgi:hypothetical protein